MASTGFCPYCGAPTVAQATTCAKCGAQLPRKAEAVDGGWMPLAAGVLDIIAGAIGVAFGIVVLVLGGMIGGMVAMYAIPGVGQILAGAAAIPLVLGIVAIVGGVYALKRRIWGLALAGSICSLIVWFLGIPAIVFTALGKKHFK